MTYTPTPLDRRPGGRRPTRLARVGIAAGVAVVLALAATPADAAGRRTPGDGSTSPAGRSTAVRVDRAEHPIELLALTCRQVGGRDDAIGCAWRTPQHPDAAGVRLVRTSTSGDARTTVYRSADLSIATAIDAPVRPGVRYVYRLQALSASGRIVGVSRPETAAVPVDDPADPGVEVLRLSCSPTSPTRVACEWSAPTVDGVRRLTLWRSVDGGARERVASFPAPIPTSYVDVVPADASRAVYAVIAENGDGRIVARSRPDGVTLGSPPTSVDDVPQRAPETAPTVPGSTMPGSTVPEIDSTTTQPVPSSTTPPTTPATAPTSTAPPLEQHRDAAPASDRRGAPEPAPDSRSDRVRPER